MSRKKGVNLCCGLFVFCLLTHSFCLSGRVTLLESAFGVAMDAWCEKGVICVCRLVSWTCSCVVHLPILLSFWACYLARKCAGGAFGVVLNSCMASKGCHFVLIVLSLGLVCVLSLRQFFCVSGLGTVLV